MDPPHLREKPEASAAPNGSPPFFIGVRKPDTEQDSLYNNNLTNDKAFI
jgi:hypothetical protein